MDEEVITPFPQEANITLWWHCFSQRETTLANSSQPMPMYVSRHYPPHFPQSFLKSLPHTLARASYNVSGSQNLILISFEERTFKD